MSAKRVTASHWYTVKTFVGDAAFLGSGDPVEKAAKNAAEQADIYLGELNEEYEETHIDFKVISTTTHALGTGDYFNFIITLTIEFTDDDEESEVAE